MVASQRKRDWRLILVLGVGALLRLVLGFYSPPNNAFDDYLEPIAYYINNDHRPSPATCWECYQPPLFFYIAEGIYKVSFFITDSYFYAWKGIQLFNTLLSIGTLLLIYKVLSENFPNDRNTVLIVLALVSIYPRDIYTSAMIANDPLLVFFVTLSVYLFLKYTSRNNYITLIFLCLSVFAAAFTKQHGLITLLFLGAVGIRYLYQNRKKISQSLFAPSILLPFLTIILCLSDELWKYNVTHQILVSNQHFFDYASGQLPGSLEKIEFFSFRLPALLNHSFLGSATVYSYWTVIFASAWFDYEWRYTAPHLPMVKYLATTLYVFGMVIMTLWLTGIIKAFRKKKEISFTHVILLLAGLCFLFVPFLQILRFPYYSSMKSLFFLPALSIMALVLVYGLRKIDWLNNITVENVLIGTTLIIGITHIVYVVSYLPLSLSELSGPLWSFPHILLP